VLSPVRAAIGFDSNSAPSDPRIFLLKKKIKRKTNLQ
jgi:hypothetical protein